MDREDIIFRTFTGTPHRIGLPSAAPPLTAWVATTATNKTRLAGHVRRFLLLPTFPYGKERLWPVAGKRRFCLSTPPPTCARHHSSRPLPPPHHHTHAEAILARYAEAGEEARVVVPDLRGINASFAASDPPAAFDYWALVNDTAALVTGAAGGPVHVVAEGLGGGMLGWGLAHRFPAQVRSLYSIASPHPGEKKRNTHAAAVPRPTAVAAAHTSLHSHC